MLQEGKLLAYEDETGLSFGRDQNELQCFEWEWRNQKARGNQFAEGFRQVVQTIKIQYDYATTDFCPPSHTICITR